MYENIQNMYEVQLWNIYLDLLIFYLYNYIVHDALFLM